MSERSMLSERSSFVGRFAELSAVRQLLRSSAVDGLRILLVAGEAGIGKTSLIERALALEAGGIGRVVRMRCAERPLNPSGELLNFVGSLIGASAARQLASDLRGTAAHIEARPRTESEARVGGTLARIAERALTATTDRHAVVLVEDVHWVDPIALRFLELFTDELVHAPLRPLALVVLHRVLPPHHAAVPFVTGLAGYPPTQQILLPALSVSEEEDLVRDRAKRPSKAFVDLVRRSSDGNPLRALAAIEALQRRGLSTNAAPGDLRVRGTLQLPRAPFSDPVTTWLNEIDGDVRATLAGCAALTAEFTLEDAAAAVGRTIELTSVELDRAVGMGVLATDGNTFWFGHAQYRHVLYAGLSPGERRAIHLRCLRDLEARAINSGRPADALAIGQHLLSAGPSAPGGRRWQQLCAAGDAAMAAAAWPEACRFYEAALSEPIADDATDLDLARAPVRLRAGQAHYFNYDEAAGAAQLRAAINDAKAKKDEASWSAAVITLARLTNTMHTRAYQQPGDMLLIEELLEIVEDRIQRALLLEVLAEAHSGAGRMDAAERYAEEAIRLLDGSDNHRALALCHFALSYASLSGLRLRSAVASGRVALGHAALADDWFVAMAIKARVIFAHAGSGDLVGAERLAAEAIDSAAVHHEFAGQALGQAMLCAVAMLKGDYADAERRADQSGRAARRSGHAAAAFHIAPMTVALHLARNRLDDAAAELASWPDLPPLALDPLRALVDLGRNVDQRDVLRLPRGRPTWLGSGIFAAETALALARADRQWLANALDDLRQLERLGLVFTVSYPASLARLIGDALLVLEDYEEAAPTYQRAIPLLRQARAYPELARALIGRCRAEARRPGGSTDVARAAAAEALDLAERLELPQLVREAAALRRREIDLPQAVRSRAGEWRVILVTDVVGSSDVSRRLGDLAYHRLIMRHHALVRRCVEERAGREFSDSGDGLYVWFSTTTDAIEAALTIQDQAIFDAQDGVGLSIKVALAGGQPLIRDGRPYGLIVNRAARLVGLARGGEVVVDEAVAADLAEADLVLLPGDEIDLRGLGAHRPVWVSQKSVSDPTGDLSATLAH